MTHEAPSPESLLEHREWLRAIARSLVRDENVVDDVEQRTWLTVLRNRRPVTSARGWLRRVVRSAAVDEHRSESRRHVREEGAARPEGLPSTDHLVMEVEAQRVVAQAVAGLPEPYRTTVLLRYIEELSVHDVAARMDVPVKTVETRLRRAIALLREALDREFGDRRAWGLLLLPLARDRAPIPIGAATAGATIVAASTKLMAACVAIVVAALAGVWWTVEHGAAPADGTTATADSATTAGRTERHRVRTVVAGETETAPADDLPPPVDLDRCDRERDLFGRVVDETAQPVAGATLKTSSHPWASMVPYAPVARTAEDGPATRTARDGTFALHLPRGSVVDLRVAATGFAEIVRPNCPAGERVTLTLVRGAALDVATIDERGATVPGVRIHVRRQQPGDWIEQDRDGVTDPTGRAVFSGLVAGRVSVSFQCDTVGAPEWQYATIPATGTVALRVTLPAGRTVRGRVSDADTGAPIAGARVGSDWVLNRPVTTDADGRYAFPGWSGRDSSVLAVAADGRPSIWKKVPADGDLDFALVVGDRVAGRVVRADGTPVVSARVAVTGGGGSGRNADSLTTTTGAGGLFELAGLWHDAPHTLVAAAPGLGRALVDFDPPADAKGVVQLGDVVLRDGRTIEGTAMDGDGRPLADVAVYLSGANDDRDRLRRSGPAPTGSGSELRRTDDRGRFRFTDIAPGTYSLALQVQRAPTVPRVRVFLPPETDVTGLRLRLAGSQTVTLLVVDDTGAPQEDVNFQVRGSFPEVDGVTPMLFGGTDRDGRATFIGLPATETRAWASSQKDFLYEAIPPFVPAGQEIRVALRRAVVIKGVMRGEDGRPVPNLSIGAFRPSDGGDAGSGSGDDTGEFTMKIAAGETVDLRVDGYQSIHTKEMSTSTQTDWRGELAGVTGPATGLVVPIRKRDAPTGRRLTVVVRDSTSVPVRGMQVFAGRGESGANASGVTDESGRIELAGLANEEVTVIVYSSAGWAPARSLDVPPKPVRVVPGGQEVTLDCRAGVLLRGRVVGPDKQPFGNMWLYVRDPGDEGYAVRVDASGRFAVPVVAGVPHTLTCSRKNGDEEWSATLADVVAGAEEVTLRAAPPPK
jgi:RNA polymerase sigma-70 factor (ECF subfamily)